MRSFSVLTALCFITFGIFSTQSASAQTETAAVPAESHSDLHLHLSGQVGAFGGGAGSGMSTGALVLVQSGIFEAGPQGQLGSALFGYSYGSLGAVAGVGLTPADRWRIDILGELGIDSYSSFGGNQILSQNPGASATLPYGGARVALTRRFRAFELGVSTAYSNDLGRSHVSYTYTDSGWYGGAPTPESRSVSIGADRLSAMLSLGAGFDL